jgi:ATP-dependent Clp protease ATP-binding subunit ClpC
MSERFLPDKAIDALDEAGSRVHISNIVVPKEITDVEQKLQDIKDKKTEVRKHDIKSNYLHWKL